MIQKVIDQFAYFGSIALFGALFRYTVSGWDWIAQTLVYGGLGLIVVYLIVHLDGIRSFLKTRVAHYGGKAGATVLLVLGILVLVNFLNIRHHGRMDLTENQRYSLSDQSLKVIENLQGEIQIIGFFRGAAGRLRFEDLIKQYRSPRIKYQIVDPEEDPGLAAQSGITREGQIVVVSGEEQVLLNELSEEKVTNAIIKITREEEKVIYFLQGHGERDINDGSAEGFSLARQEVENQNYRVESYNLAQQNRLPEDATVIVSAGPRIDFLPTEVALLKKFLEEGGKLLLLVDPQTEFGMGEFLADYGLVLGHKVVIDASGIGQLFGLGAAAPLVSEFGDHPMTQELGGVMTFFPMAQNVTTSSSALDYRTQELLTTSPRSWAESQLEEGEMVFDEGQDTQGPLHLAAAATLRVEDLPNSDEKAQKVESRFVLIGDADFASNAYFDSASNGDLFLMAVGWLAEETDLLAIRPKDPENRRINVTLSQSRMIFWVSVVFLPLAMLVLGTTIWMRRR